MNRNGLLLVLLVSLPCVWCGPASIGDPDGGAPDAGNGPVARTDLVPRVGTDATLDLATWNLREFPTGSEHPGLVADLVASLDLDLVVLQEIGSAAAFAAADALLPEHEGLLPLDASGQPLGIAFLWRSTEVQLGAPETLFTAQTDVFPRPPVTVPVRVNGEGSWELVAVHLKAGTTAADEQKREEANAALESWVRGRVEGPESDRILVIGDFNEAFGDPNVAAVFEPWTAAPERYRWLTAPFETDGTMTFLPAGIVLDHLIATAALDDLVSGAAPFVPPVHEQLDDYERRVSDHLPVVLSLPAD